MNVLKVNVIYLLDHDACLETIKLFVSAERPVTFIFLYDILYLQ